uniref:Uncharacterized protein n=1 Tax=Anguilla anguilla TaxID=7936 RepID=A0A0E9WZT6_ANGAN
MQTPTEHYMGGTHVRQLGVGPVLEYVSREGNEDGFEGETPPSQGAGPQNKESEDCGSHPDVFAPGLLRWDNAKLYSGEQKHSEKDFTATLYSRYRTPHPDISSYLELNKDFFFLMLRFCFSPLLLFWCVSVLVLLCSLPAAVKSVFMRCEMC